ncbi:unnamed protein product [Microthlaspi erraticum]|uniref:Uncharacterized protein n=1 Tax=Microthlaspi erraticum TaxID=1685480 RepID=A0A6D2HNP5_9BRAS|nr:unnamed protein product [Microthlaspi erraticum]
MASTKGPVKKGQPSIKHSCNFDDAKRKLSKISDHAFQRHNRKRGETRLSQILSRDALVSVVDLMWDRSDFASSNLISSQKQEKLDDLSRDEDRTLLPAAPQSRVQLVSVAEKVCYNNQNYSQSFFSCFNQISGAKENGLPLEAKWERERLYSWIEKKEDFEDRVSNPESSKAECASGNDNSSDSVFVTTGSEGNSTSTESRSPLLGSITGSSGDTRISRSTDANYLFLLYKDRCAKRMNILSSECSKDCHTESTSSDNNPHKDGLSVVENKELLERDRKDQETEVCSPSTEAPTYAFAKQRHAFAGALAGISVSLCLHPLDTVKTMIQSCRLEEKSLCYTGRTIISERGFSGLYRGIASNIASSAPISALYTFTYESVKGSLLPLFPKEYCSLTHCIAGGSASVATSFIFTPSERIKQQMQVSSHYRNCWTALVGIIQKGGLLSLYAGWSAVLCRNIPHSIIKFYVYENMKRMVLPSLGPHDQAAKPTTSQTLLCGGLAGSAAAFFTTPFDVVKTRLQTQIPGSRNQHPSVYQTLQSIRKQEGLRGLYRGLIPRLVMYMSQGAIFFASYEFYKSVLSLEAAQPDLSALWHKTKDGDNPNSL